MAWVYGQCVRRGLHSAAWISRQREGLRENSLCFGNVLIQLMYKNMGGGPVTVCVCVCVWGGGGWGG